MRSRFRLKRWTGFAVLAVLGSAILSACDGSPAFIDPRGPVAATESTIWWIIFGICVFVFVGVTSVLLYSVIRFRARPGSPEPRQIHGNTTIEIIWTIAPTLLLMGILAMTIGTMFGPLQQPTGQPTLNVKAIGHQWWFEFSYPDANPPVVTADELHVPVGEVVSVSLVSDNVIHGFWVPQLAGKLDIIPGHDNVMWFKADVAGTYRGECTEFCGAQHAHMDFVVVAQSQADYNAWLAAQQSAPATPVAGSPEANGAALFKSAGCSGCHAIGTPAQGAVLIGPNLTHFGSRLLIAGGVLDNNSTNLASWITDAQKIKPDSDMPAFNGSPGAQGNLTADQVNDLVLYLESLK
jgi:cytochrome c oxidase subunit 2